MTFTNMAYSEFDTTQANLLADLRTAILASASWTRPNSGSKPDTYKCTTTRGADMVFDLSDAAISLFAMTIGVWKSYDGTTFVDKTQRWLYWRASGGVSTNTLHCTVSVSKEHVFIMVEGPRANETTAESAAVGSAKQSFFMSDVVPYHAGDTTPVVFAGGNMSAAVGSTNAALGPMGNLSRNYANSSSWVQSRLLTLGFPSGSVATAIHAQRIAVGDGNYYLWPYVSVADADGLRGRLAAFFHAGMVVADIGSVDLSPAVVGAKVTYDGQLYKLLTTTRAGTNIANWNQFGAAATNTGAAQAIIVAVPTV